LATVLSAIQDVLKAFYKLTWLKLLIMADVAVFLVMPRLHEQTANCRNGQLLISPVRFGLSGQKAIPAQLLSFGFLAVAHIRLTEATASSTVLLLAARRTGRIAAFIISWKANPTSLLR
jgi:hypothetical protein